MTMNLRSDLFDLPNELFLLIFQYLSSADLIDAFISIGGDRITGLLKSFVLYLDITKRSDLWIKLNLSHILMDYSVSSIRLEDRQIDLIPMDFYSNEMRSMEVVSSDWKTDYLKESLNRLRKHLDRLTIRFVSSHGQDDIGEHLFRSDSNLEELNIHGRFLYFNHQEIDVSNRLRCLSIELDDIHRLLSVMQYLPRLEDLKVKFRGEERFFPSWNFNVENKENSSLKIVEFTGRTKYLDKFEKFCSMFGSKICSLLLDLDLGFNFVDGRKLEEIFLNKLLNLEKLDLILYSSSVRSENFQMETFQTCLWKKFSPIVYWCDAGADGQLIFTTPFRSDKVKFVSNESMSSWICNRSPVSLSFDNVRSLIIYATSPLTLETFRSIEKYFVNVRQLEIRSPIRKTTIEQNDETQRKSSYFADDLLENQDLVLPSVTKLCLPSMWEANDYRAFVRLVQLLPNFISLQMFIGRDFYREILLNNEDKQFLSDRLKSIRSLQMVRFYDGKKLLTDRELESLFPCALIHFDEDDR